MNKIWPKLHLFSTFWREVAIRGPLNVALGPIIEVSIHFAEFSNVSAGLQLNRTRNFTVTLLEHNHPPNECKDDSYGLTVCLISSQETAVLIPNSIV